MASFHAIETVCKAVIDMVEASVQGQGFGDNLEFDVYSTNKFQNGMDQGVSLFLYRIQVNGSHRIPSGKRSPNGRHNQTQLPLDLHFLLSFWATDASLQNRLAGWTARLLEDFPILPAAYLNTVSLGVFNTDENVEIVLADMSNDDLLHLWETLGANRYQLSIPYIARNVRIESNQELDEGLPINERLFEFYRIPKQLEDI